MARAEAGMAFTWSEVESSRTMVEEVESGRIGVRIIAFKPYARKGK